jgi:hypothetical protein
MVTLLPT